MKMEEVCSAETLASTRQSTPCQTQNNILTAVKPSNLRLPADVAEQAAEDNTWTSETATNRKTNGLTASTFIVLLFVRKAYC
jgi:hypothetical protein